jgi:diacylglycerol kinase family enzyme
LRRVEVVANTASGGVGSDAPAELAKILSDFGISANVCAPHTDDLTRCLSEAITAAPDLLVVLAGDGTLRAAAQLCGAKGPVMAPLPGGTMNMLPHAVYGRRSWQDALSTALAQGEEMMLGGGEVEGHVFLVAAILGSPALWAPAREAARFRKARLAWLRARIALQRTFTGRLRYALDNGYRDKAVALSFLCPLISRALDETTPALEAAILDIHRLRDVVSLGFHAMTGDWREASGVEATQMQIAQIWAAERIPAILDGEAVRLTNSASVAYKPDVVRVLGLPRALREP